MSSGFRSLTLGLACALVLPGVGSAQDAPRPDPDSPAGVEYKLPLDQARRDAAPDRDPARGGGAASDPAPLFGAGITPQGGPASGSNGRGSSAGGPDLASKDTPEGDRAAPSAQTGPQAGRVTAKVAPAAAADGGGGTDLTLGAIALAVVLSGLGLGLLLRRGIGRPDPS